MSETSRTYFGFAIADSMFPADCMVRRKEIDVDTVRAIVSCGVIPCLNPAHTATINAMRQRFGINVPIPEMPPRVELAYGDDCIVMSIRGLPRLTDRREYTEEEISKADFRFFLYEIARKEIRHHDEDWKLSYHSDGQGNDLGVIISDIRDAKDRHIMRIRQHRSDPGDDITRYHNAMLVAEAPKMFRLLQQVRGLVNGELGAEINSVIHKVTEG